MSRGGHDLASSLRTCPVCDSEAIMASSVEDAGPAGLRCMLRCGGCETWRGAILSAPQGFALEFWLGRRDRKGRRWIAREVRRLERGGRGRIGGPLSPFLAWPDRRLVASHGMSDGD
jgi:hypothetical protein